MAGAVCHNQNCDQNRRAGPTAHAPKLNTKLILGQVQDEFLIHLLERRSILLLSYPVELAASELPLGQKPWCH